jgi:hypothetical protein
LDHEQPFEDHRVGDVIDLEFVEAQECRLGRDVGGDLGDRPAGFGPPFALDPVVRAEHEGMKVRPPLVHRAHGAKEQIHQHGLAAADRTAVIKPVRRRAAVVLGEAEAGEPACNPVSGR